MAEYLGIVQMGGFYKKSRIFKTDKVLKRPTRPLCNAQLDCVYKVNNIPKMSGSMSSYIISDTPSKEENQLIWHKMKDGNKILFICDRNILVSVSWNDLNEQGYIFGKNVIIDGKQYLCRVLTGGTNFRKGKEKLAASAENEWDRFICCEEAIAGIPKPLFIDLNALHILPGC